MHHTVVDVRRAATKTGTGDFHVREGGGVSTHSVPCLAHTCSADPGWQLPQMSSLGLNSPSPAAPHARCPP